MKVEAGGIGAWHTGEESGRVAKDVLLWRSSEGGLADRDLQVQFQSTERSLRVQFERERLTGIGVRLRNQRRCVLHGLSYGQQAACAVSRGGR